jgi:large subunit ribosomal protein L29
VKVEEIRGLSPEDLVKQRDAARKELFELRFKLATRQLVNHRQIREVKKNIARLNTVLREKELGGS